MAIIMQQDATEYSLFQSFSFSKSSRLATFTRGSSTSIINARYCRYSVISSWWWVKYNPKHVEQLTDWNKLYSVASCSIIIAILYDAASIEHKILVYVWIKAVFRRCSCLSANFAVKVLIPLLTLAILTRCLNKLNIPGSPIFSVIERKLEGGRQSRWTFSHQDTRSHMIN